MIRFLCALTALVLSSSARADCPTQSVDVDPSLATAREIAFLGEDFGETFVARDSFLVRVTLWQPAGTDTFPVPITFLLFDTDAAGTPLRSTALLVGPTVTIPVGNSAGPVAVSFELSPAFRLPHLGSFQAAFRAPCESGLWLLECGGNPFAEGSFQWNRAARCPPWSQVTAYPTVDLAFSAELCDHDPSSTTPAAGTSWGQLRAIYRR
jgi:hypothetical protein